MEIMDNTNKSLEEKLNGLSDSEVLASREKYGRNEIEEAPPETFLQKVIGALNDPMLILLLVIATGMLILSFFKFTEWYESVGTYVAVALVAIIGARTEMASDTKFRELKESTKAEPVRVYRNGVISVIDISEVVVGDIIDIQNGDKIPADGVLLKGKITVNNSSLNGETEECKKFAAPENYEFPAEVTGDTLVDENTLFKGTTIYNGEGLMEVHRVGMKTMMGEMAADMNDDDVDSPLKVKLAKLAKQISVFGYVGAAVIAIVYMIHFVIQAGGFSDYFALGGMHILMDFIDALMIAIMIVVCAVPEGLPLMIALVLQANTSVMLENNVLVRKAIGIETAGSLNILFSDKTGTITKGQLEVVELFTGDATSIQLDKLSEQAGKINGLLDVCMAKNTLSMFDDKGNVVGGNLTEHALLKFLGKEQFNAINSEHKYDVTKEQSFNSSNKFSQVFIQGMDKTFYKGAPERLLAKAKKYLNTNGEVVDLDRKVVDKYIDELANRAMRVLAFGYSEKELTEDKINDDVVILGFVGIRDDVRPEARDAIAEVQGAGIQVVMITGDRLETAVAIGKDANLLSGDAFVITPESIVDDTKVVAEVEKHETIAISSEALNKLSDDTIKKILTKIRVIARALPKDKSRMVKLAQELNLVCGMTGDGVNDSPALKRADVGFAMGSGTEAAKEAGDLIIIDDNFFSIRNAVLYGRTIYENILKFCKFQLGINVSAVLISALLPFFGIESPLTVTQLLFVNLCMDSLGSLMLGKEPAKVDYLKKPPRRRDESIISKKMFVQFTLMGIYLTVLSFIWFKSGIFDGLFKNDMQFKTGFFAVYMFSSIMNGFNVRTNGFGIFKDLKKNKQFVGVLAAMLGSTFLLCNLSVVSKTIGNMFSTQAFSPVAWIVILALSFGAIVFDLIRKAIAGTYKEET